MLKFILKSIEKMWSALLSFFLFFQKTDIQNAVPFDFSEPEKTVVLPIELKEVSGIALGPEKNQITAIGDERGELFFICKKTGVIEGRRVFREKGDFEDLAFVGKTCWAVKSDGDIFEIDLADATAEPKKYKSGWHSEVDDIEGICFDEKGNRLLLAAKSNTENFDLRKIWAFDLATKTFQKEPVFSLDPQKIEEKLPENERGKKPFSPSAIAVRSATDEIYLISSVGKKVAVVSRNGEILAAAKLEKDLLPQPEGMAFEADGDLWISSEGKTGQAVLLKFKPRK